jgi:hypothetical protein
MGATMDKMTVEPSATAPVEGPKPDRVDPRPSVRLAWGLWLLVVLVEGLVIAFLLANDGLTTRELITAAATWVPFLAFATVGAVILARRPGNRVGWLCWAIGFAITVSIVGSKQVWAVLADQGRSSAWAVLPQLGTMLWLGTLLGLLPFLVLLFPTGRLLSPRWRPVAWALGLVLGLYLIARLFIPGPIDLSLPVNPDNPLGIESAEGLLRLVQNLVGVAVPFLILAVLASVVVRFRRSQGEERQQLKWFSFVVAAELVLLPGLGGLAERVAPEVGALVVFPASISLIPIAIGVAVLKYRLYDIDRLINRTLVYGLLTALLIGVYAGLVFLLGRLLDPATGDSALAVAASTLAVAALFQPARRRVQTVVDRRFNRRKYNAAKTIEGFSARLRDQVDLDTLATELLAVTDKTMQPTTVSLWLRPPDEVSKAQAPRWDY